MDKAITSQLNTLPFVLSKHMRNFSKDFETTIFENLNMNFKQFDQREKKVDNATTINLESNNVTVKFSYLSKITANLEQQKIKKLINIANTFDHFTIKFNEKCDNYSTFVQSSALTINQNLKSLLEKLLEVQEKIEAFETLNCSHFPTEPQVRIL